MGPQPQSQGLQWPRFVLQQSMLILCLGGLLGLRKGWEEEGKRAGLLVNLSLEEAVLRGGTRCPAM